MQTLHFTKEIKASKEKVWQILWSPETYHLWTSVFGGEGNKAEGEWKEGGKIWFTGEGGGIFTTIEKMRKNEEIIFCHGGEIKDGKEIINEWAGAHESYLLIDKAEFTILEVTHEVTDEFVAYFQKTYPLALDKIKELAEIK